MDNANMPPGSDNSNDSDDLIAELARLMAAEAKGEPEVPAPPPAPEPPVAQSHDAPAPEALVSDEPKSDPIPRLNSAPEPQRPAPAFMRPPSAAEPSVAPSHPDPMADSPFSVPASAPQKEVFTPPAPTPPSAKAAPLEDRFTFEPIPVASDGGAGQPDFGTPAQAASVQTDDADDPIGALISAQLESIGPEEFAEAPMTPPPTPPQQSAKDDSFGVAPVFGLGGASQNAENTRAKRDPLDDIESLIGAALKTDHRPEQPVERPVEPRVAAAPDEQITGAANAAEAAILAATQSMRPQDNNSSASFDQSYGMREPTGQRDVIGGMQPGSRPGRNASARKRNWRKIAGPAVAAGLLIAVGLGLYWVFGSGGDEIGDAPVLSADATPAKQTPAATANDTSGAGSVVLSDNGSQPETIERLISRDDTSDVAGNDVSRVITQNDPDEIGPANRKVRTVTVRPDGTIVSGDDAVAGGQQLPVDRPNVPQLSAADTPSAVAANQTITTPQALAAQNTSVGSNNGVNPPIPFPRPTNRASAPTAAISVPVSTPSGSNSNAVNLIANAANQTANSTQNTVARQNTSAAVATGSSAPAYVQLSSQRNQDAASRSLAAVRSQFGSQFNGGTLEIQEVNLGDRGVFYRVRLPAQSIEAANNVCANIKTAGGDCFVRTD